MSNLFTRPQHKAGSLLRGLSKPLWDPSDLEYVRLGGMDRGYGFIDDFLSANEVDNYTLTTVNNGTFALVDAKGGHVDADSASDTANDGVNVQRGDGTVGELFIPSADSNIRMEARVKLTDIGTSGSDTVDFVFGLAEEATDLCDTNGLNQNNHVVFNHSVDNDGALDVSVDKAGTATTATGLHTLSDGTWFKLGFIIEGVSKVRFFINGAEKKAKAITTNIPIVAMKPSLVLQSAGTTDPICTIDWIACYQFEQESHT